MPTSNSSSLSPLATAPLTGLGQALRWLREKQTRKQYRVADSAGITKGMLSAYETGRQRPSLDTLEKLLESLGCDLNDLHNALQIVNGRPELIKSWRGWHTTSWLDGGAAPGRPLTGVTAPSTRYNQIGDVHDPIGVAGAIDEVRQPKPPNPFGASGSAQSTDPEADSSAPDLNKNLGAQLYGVLGLDQPSSSSQRPLALEEEQALGQMLEGFHNLLRYWHQALAATPAPPYKDANRLKPSH